MCATGGQLRSQIEAHIVDVLAPQGFVMLVTSRANGVARERFLAAGFQELSLKPLTDEQQISVIERRLPEADRAAALVRYVTQTIRVDVETGEKVTPSPLMHRATQLAHTAGPHS